MDSDRRVMANPFVYRKGKGVVVGRKVEATMCQMAASQTAYGLWFVVISDLSMSFFVGLSTSFSIFYIQI